LRWSGLHVADPLLRQDPRAGPRGTVGCQVVARLGSFLDARRLGCYLSGREEEEEKEDATADLPRCASCRVSIKPGQNVVFRPDRRVQHVGCPEVVWPICSRLIRPSDPIRRDGEALLHGNCWMRRYRAATNPPVKVKREPNGITSVVRTKLKAGQLPRIEAKQVLGGRGSGLPCSGCDHAITQLEVEHEIDLNGSTLRFHRTQGLVEPQRLAADPALLRHLPDEKAVPVHRPR
jgi:hypothetical protein